MMRIDDWQPRLEDGFIVPVEPILIDSTGETARVLGHGWPPSTISGEGR
jgi:hypothetical protein